MDKQQIKEEIRKVKEKLMQLGCSDGSCLIFKPEGMYTNGGCQHLKIHPQDREHWLQVRQALYVYRDFLETIGKALE